MSLLYSDVIEHVEIEKELGIRKVALEQLLAEADFVSVYVPGGGETKHLIGAEELAMMKPTAFVINCSRGGVVDEAALTKALEAGTLAGAGLDVYESEPTVAEKAFNNPIGKVAKVYGTHHIEASTQQAQVAVADHVVKIVRAYVDNSKFLNCVNPPDAKE